MFQLRDVPKLSSPVLLNFASSSSFFAGPFFGLRRRSVLDAWHPWFYVSIGWWLVFMYVYVPFVWFPRLIFTRTFITQYESLHDPKARWLPSTKVCMVHRHAHYPVRRFSSVTYEHLTTQELGQLWTKKFSPSFYTGRFECRIEIWRHFLFEY